jgi:hypothetical protein
MPCCNPSFSLRPLGIVVATWTNSVPFKPQIQLGLTARRGLADAKCQLLQMLLQSTATVLGAGESVVGTKLLDLLWV